MLNFWWLAGLVDGLEPHPPCLSSQKLNCSSLDYIQLLMLVGLVDGLKPHPPHLSSQKNEMLIFGVCSTFDDWLGWLMDLNATCSTSLQPKKWNAHSWITFNFWWSAGLVDGLKPLPPPLSSQKNKILAFGLCSTSDDQPGWWMDSNPICHPSPAKKMKCSFLEYVQLLMIRLGWLMDLTPQPPPLFSQE